MTINSQCHNRVHVLFYDRNKVTFFNIATFDHGRKNNFIGQYTFSVLIRYFTAKTFFANLSYFLKRFPNLNLSTQWQFKQLDVCGCNILFKPPGT
jgi:hypothetical protein